ncbi:RHS repeat-associated core domain-containing protein [Candidatus Woesearchaeota archaeon]|nr:RHS repeat-associated core domain-containing protein [Candidatus Woesearchaeota archaeon]
MKYLIVIILIFLLVSSATAGQLTMSPSEELDYIEIPEIIKNITINITDNITENISIINITDNITIIHITDNISIINITDNISIINITDNLSIINLTNITDINLTEFNITEDNLTDNLTLNQTEILESPEFEQLQYNTTNYYYAGPRLLASEANEVITYHYQDRLGSDVNSKTLPFGQEIINDERFSFTGKELDDELYYFNARYYDSDLGRFTSIDPINENEPYSYVENNPVNYVDPDGKDSVNTIIRVVSFSRAYFEAENAKQKAKVIAKRALSQSVRYTNDQIDDLGLSSSSRTILKTNVRVLDNAVKLVLSDEENKAELLKDNLVEDTIMTVFKGPLGTTCYGACKDATKTLIEFTDSESTLTPKNLDKLKNIEDSQEEFEYNGERPLFDWESSPTLKMALEEYESDWTKWWSLQDTVASSDLPLMNGANVEIRKDLVIIN